jgi:hypothetical protein
MIDTCRIKHALRGFIEGSYIDIARSDQVPFWLSEPSLHHAGQDDERGDSDHVVITRSSFMTATSYQNDLALVCGRRSNLATKTHEPVKVVSC